MHLIDDRLGLNGAVMNVAAAAAKWDRGIFIPLSTRHPPIESQTAGRGHATDLRLKMNEWAVQLYSLGWKLVPKVLYYVF